MQANISIGGFGQKHAGYVINVSSRSPYKVVHGGLLDADLLHVRVLLGLEGERLRLHGLQVLPVLDALRRARRRGPVFAIECFGRKAKQQAIRRAFVR